MAFLDTLIVGPMYEARATAVNVLPPLPARCDSGSNERATNGLLQPQGILLIAIIVGHKLRCSVGKIKRIGSLNMPS